VASMVMYSGILALTGNLFLGSCRFERYSTSFLICFELNESTCSKGKSLSKFSG
jgi:hypothetical protein